MRAWASHEIDYVINITKLKEKNYHFTEEEMAEIIEMCRVALNVQPDFIKTSTGFGTGGAAFKDVALMKRMVGDEIKIKAAGLTPLKSIFIFKFGKLLSD